MNNYTDDLKAPIQESRKELIDSIQVVKRNLKVHATNKINYRKAIVKNVETKVINAFKQFQSNIKNKLNEKKANIDERKLNFKNGVTQKVSTAKSKIGNAKNSFLAKLSKNNIDAKLRQFIDYISLMGLSTLNKGINAINNVKDNIADFTSTQIANYYLRKEELEQKKLEQERQKRIEEAERREELERQKRTEEKKAAMKDALKADKIQKREDRILHLRTGFAYKTTSIKSVIGNAKNSFLAKLSKENIDAKLRQFVDSVSIIGLTALNKGINTVNNIKDKLADFTSTQIANYYLKKEEKEQAKMKKQSEDNNLESELINELEIKKRTEEHKEGMKEVIHDIERNELDKKHEENKIKKAQLLEELKKEKQRLSSFYQEQELYKEEVSSSKKR